MQSSLSTMVAISRSSRGRIQWRAFVDDALLPNERRVDLPFSPGQHAEEILIGNIPPGFRDLAIAVGRGICRQFCLPQ
jgi:hypothetical protein